MPDMLLGESEVERLRRENALLAGRLEAVVRYCSRWCEEAEKRVLQCQGVEAEYWRTKGHTLRVVESIVCRDSEKFFRSIDVFYKK